MGGEWSTNGNNTTDWIADIAIEADKDYYIVTSYSSGVWKHSVYDESGTLVDEKSKSESSFYNNTSAYIAFGGCFSTSSPFFPFRDGVIYPAECFIEIGDNLIWGQKNSITENF